MWSLRETLGMCMQRRNLVRTQQGGRHQKANERPLKENQTHGHLDLRLLASKSEKVNLCCLNYPVCVFSL